MTFATAKTIAKWAWTIAILGIVVWFCVTRWDKIVQTLATLPAGTIALATLAIVLAKFGLVLTMRTAAIGAGLPLSVKDSYWIYNMTQLGKYVPGSIWQFVGRVVILKRRGAPGAKIRDAMLSEHGWVLSTALAISAVLILLAQPHFFLDWADSIDISPWLSLGLVLGVVGFVFAAGLVYYRGRLIRWLWRMRPPPSAILVLAITWLLLGLSYWITLGPFATSPVPWYYAVGIYCFAYIAGFMVPFAPAGLGIRESILTFAMLPYLPIETSVLLASMNRVVYFAAELIVVVPCFFMEREGGSAPEAPGA
ncbi:lysylphosphatidylglycerol synthase domain-containing protein [Aquibium oceanicum]|uniref:Flippase-like domain-containing protein n=1 Tax=Aquibium oceanicum TaxID=1670800 RepID=A0A1L3SU72_9HYPH|nr:lysylphosphatidylglycerol synthase domain-containing protein [Aquibium oceanicum]APH72949.1 hypothetical protein BSQ44_17435 [Aquibium oceanicum]